MSSNGAANEDPGSLPYSCQCVLTVLAYEGPQLSRQALLQNDQLDITDRTLSRALDTLESGGYVTVARNPGDLRQVVVTLSDEHVLNTPESDR